MGMGFLARRTSRRWARSPAWVSFWISWRRTRAAFCPGVTVDGLDDNVARVDLNWPMPALRRIWTKAGGYPSYFKDHVAC